MESSVIQKHRKRVQRARSVRKLLRGSFEKPRLSVMKSNQHIAAQLIDDETGTTLVSASTLMKKLRAKGGKNREAAKLVGTEIAHLAKEKNITTVVFDRGFNKYHGVIAELADAARAGGLQF